MGAGCGIMEKTGMEASDMDSKTDNVVKNIGALAEATSVFYNAISKRVPRDVALALTQHFMNMSAGKRVTAIPLTPQQLAALTQLRHGSAEGPVVKAQQHAASQRDNKGDKQRLALDLQRLEQAGLCSEDAA